MRYALINEITNLVENIIIINDLEKWTIPNGFYIIEVINGGATGDSYVGDVFDDQPRKDAEAIKRSEREKIESDRQSGLAKLGLTEDEIRALGL